MEMKRASGFCAIACLTVFFTYSQALFDNAADMGNAGLAEQEFRRGVQSFYRGAFNEAIIQFERALSYLPDEALILDWLGNAYFRAGFEGAALTQWEYAAQSPIRGSDAAYGGLLLQNRIDIVRSRRIPTSLRPELNRYTEAGSFPGVKEKQYIFNQPVSILPNPDGTCWVLSYTSNELLRMDVNGFAVDRTRGPLNGFDRPMDIVRRRDGSLLVTEFFGDRISVLTPGGSYVSSFGTKGRGEGEVIGPQYAALDSSENVYVTDFGNARVAVFDRDGNGLFSFGAKSVEFPGFKAPTGIAVIEDIVFVADAVSGAIYRFDRFGNYLGLLTPEKTCVRPEAMKAAGNYLLVADTNRILSIDTATGSVYENARTGNAPSRVTCAVPDVNGNILAADFLANEIYVMSRMDELVGGLFVQIERVVSDSFPNIVIEVSVENRRREPVVGLKAVNFLVTEEKRRVAAQMLTGAAYANDVCDITLLIDRSPNTVRQTDALNAAIKEIVAGMGGRGTLRVVSVGETPITEFAGSPSVVGDFNAARIRTPPSEFPALDLGIRLAANDLVNAEKKRAVIYLTAGDVPSSAFDRYGLIDLTAYLNNNHIAFYTVQLAQGAPSEELAYITEHTMGKNYYVYRPEGLSTIVRDVLDMPRGVYQLSYTSSLPTNFGRNFLAVEVESYILNRSGRAETGYYAPLE
jgi:DNA-binding beta-propeller fold protein YncE